MSDKIIENVDALKELNSRAQGEVSIRDALTELEVKMNWFPRRNYMLNVEDQNELYGW